MAAIALLAEERQEEQREAADGQSQNSKVSLELDKGLVSRSAGKGHCVPTRVTLDPIFSCE